jgi:hypothetical protein
MGAIKNYMMELADKLGKEFEEVTQEDFENSFNDSDTKEDVDVKEA